jgi:hypothetical protein
MMNNGSLWAHIYLIKGDHSPDPASEHYKKSALLFKRQRTRTSRGPLFLFPVRTTDVCHRFAIAQA